MDWLEFIQKSEWPAVVAGGLWWFRKPITHVLSGLRPRKVKGFGIDAEFDPEPALQKAEELTKEIPAPSTEPLKLPEHVSTEPAKPSPGMAFDKALPEQLPEQKGDELAEGRTISSQSDENGDLSSDALIIRAFRELEGTIIRAFRLRTRRSNARIPVQNAARVIGFSQDEVAALRELQQIRNQIAHDIDTVTWPVDAERFVEVAKRLKARANNLIATYLIEAHSHPTDPSQISS